MYRTGHYGVSLLVYAPLGAALLAAGYRVPALVGGAAMLALAPLPDYDQRVPFVTHRGVTHTLVFAWLVGTTLAGLTLFLPAAGPERLALASFGFGVGALGVVAHLLGDVLTPAGIRPLWPLRDTRYSLALWTADNALANYGLLGAGVAATVAVLLLLA
ncbi:hypothetical protein GCM10009037_12990 [Halarchaeum grantii]|uniref:Inner membrane protein n=1 Tax=Halarchaeum grantii TaxID=1193105 RepID=A0A830FBN8_9EURY|nr:metal-dependent hydrolase [Halarchaeum grantii]GGL30677.1 hypothetical protein GCM10009037_12990 [Halarchaeum grantii]